MELTLNLRQYLEFEKIAFGAFAPLTGFMGEDAFHSVADRMRLPGGEPFPLPVVLDVPADLAEAARGAGSVALLFRGEEVGSLVPESVYGFDKSAAARKVFGCDDPAHPGVALLRRMGSHFIGGPVRQTRRALFDFSPHELTPAQTREYFRARGWKSVVGFQTRNIPHRAHEHLQRLALTLADGLFIQPLIGRKKKGDCRPEAILAAYRTLVDNFLPSDRILLGILSTYMRYAGPREAVFHAIIRRNYGCTHFIVGRDHAGVGNYYGKYDAHELARRFAPELGIEILCFPGPFHCSRCDEIVTERTCPHLTASPEHVRQISGTDMRALLSGSKAVAPELMRPEIVASLAGLPVFIEEEDPE